MKNHKIPIKKLFKNETDKKWNEFMSNQMTEQNWKTEIEKRENPIYELIRGNLAAHNEYCLPADNCDCYELERKAVEYIQNLLDKQLSDIIKLIEGKKKDVMNGGCGIKGHTHHKPEGWTWNKALDEALTEIKKEGK